MSRVIQSERGNPRRKSPSQHELRPAAAGARPLAVDRGHVFLPGLLRRLNAGEKTSFHINEIRTPVDGDTVSASLLELAAADYRGLLYLAGCTRLSRYESVLATHLLPLENGVDHDMVIILKEGSRLRGRPAGNIF